MSHRLRADIRIGWQSKPNLFVGFPLYLFHELGCQYTPFARLDHRQPLRDLGAQILQPPIALVEQAHRGPHDLGRIVSSRSTGTR